MSTRLATVTILVEDIQRARAFYVDLLGFEVMQDFSSPAGDFLLLHASGSDANIILQDSSTTTYGVPLAHGGILVGFTVEDADAVFQDWQAKSVDILGAVFDMGAGRMFLARDPDGNYIQVYHLHPHVQGALPAQQENG